MSIPALDKPAPEFSGVAVLKSQFKTIALSDFRGKYVMMFYYPSIFSRVCPTEVQRFSKKVAAFELLNCKVIGVTYDSQYTIMASTNIPRRIGGLGKLNIPLISDINGEIAKAYGLMQHHIKSPIRGLFVIDANQVLCQATISTHHVACSVDESLRFLRIFKFSKENKQDRFTYHKS